MNSEVRKVCKTCFEKKRVDFQNTDYIKILKKAQFDLDIERTLGVNSNNKFMAEIPFQNISKVFNPECERCFYINKYNDPDKQAEGMWILIGDVNFKEKTICGVLVNNPVIFDIAIGSIIRADFKDIMDIAVM